MSKPLFSTIPTDVQDVAVRMEKPTTTAPLQANVPSVFEATDNLPSVQFTEKEKSEITQIANQLDPKNLDTVLSFGQEPASKIAAFSDKILSMSKNSDTGTFGTQLSSVVNLARGVNFKGISDHRSSVPIIGGLIDMVRQKTGDVKTNFDSISTQIDSAVTALSITEKNLGDRLVMFGEMQVLNVEEYRSFCKYKAAGQAQLVVLSKELDTKKSQITATTDPMEVQSVNDFAEYVKQLEKRLHDFDIAKMLCVQTAAEIRMLQSNNRDLISQFKDIKTMTIPAWKKQMTLYLSLQEQKNAAETSKKAKDFTNELIKSNAETLGQNSVLIAQNNQRALIDVSTLEAVNKSLIDACNRVQQIETDGQNRRHQDSAKIAQLAGDLRTKLTDTKTIAYSN